MTEDPTLRHAIGWANFWDYPHNTPTVVTDGYNGDDMIVRDLRLVRGVDGYRLASAPTAALADYVTQTHRLGDVAVDGEVDLDVRAEAYDLTCEIEWDATAAGESGEIGVEVCRARGGTRRVPATLDLPGRLVRLDRTATVGPTGGATQMPFDPSAGRVAIRVLVDRTSVELFVGDDVQSHRVFPIAGDRGIRLTARGTTARFRDVTIRELSTPMGAAR